MTKIEQAVIRASHVAYDAYAAHLKKKGLEVGGQEDMKIFMEVYLKEMEKANE
jgi:hypothetical protein